MPSDDHSTVSTRYHSRPERGVEQLTLFGENPASADPGSSAADDLPSDDTTSPLHPGAVMPLARIRFRSALEETNRSPNTISSYSFDLQKLEEITGPRRIDRVTGNHIARYLADASSPTTRKRRLTSARQFFAWLIQDQKALQFDPTEGYEPQPIRQKLPPPLTDDEQTALMEAASADEPWTATAIWLMLHAGLTRAELLRLERDHIDRTNPAQPVIHVYYDASQSGKERHIAADASFTRVYNAFLERRDPQGILFPVGRQAINGMVDRVRTSAKLNRELTPHMLRHTYAVNLARRGFDVESLLETLGMAKDPRNRETARRYIAQARDIDCDGTEQSDGDSDMESPRHLFQLSES